MLQKFVRCRMSQGGRRSFLRNVIALGMLAPLKVEAGGGTATDQGTNLDSRSQSALLMRQQAAQFECSQYPADQANNRDEITLPGYVGCFTKGLPHDQMGVVEPEAYQSLLYALSTGQHAD